MFFLWWHRITGDNICEKSQFFNSSPELELDIVSTELESMADRA